MMRLFTGIRLPLDLQKKLHALQGGIPGARWTGMENYHVTLTFIGNVDEGLAEDIDEVLSSVRGAPFSLAVKGVGIFSQGDRPRHLWAGLEHNGPLLHLKEKIDRALARHKLPFESRKYMPHITLAVLKHADDAMVGEFVQEHNLLAAPPFPVEDFVLYQSHHGREAPFYEELKSYPLG